LLGKPAELFRGTAVLWEMDSRFLPQKWYPAELELEKFPGHSIVVIEKLRPRMSSWESAILTGHFCGISILVEQKQFSRYTEACYFGGPVLGRKFE